jgi:hypothetical protein
MNYVLDLRDCTFDTNARVHGPMLRAADISETNIKKLNVFRLCYL